MEAQTGRRPRARYGGSGGEETNDTKRFSDEMILPY
jgi:hypothetical protein